MNNYPCPCCGERTLPDKGEFDLCTVCYWQDDPLQRDDPNDAPGANTLSLNDYRIKWQATSQPVVFSWRKYYAGNLR